MLNREINIAEDYLVVYRNREGKFKDFRWYYHDRVTPEQIAKAIPEWNEQQKKEECPRFAEVITDKTVREVCAYRKQSRELESLVDRVAELKREADNSIRDAISTFEDALETINDI